VLKLLELGADVTVVTARTCHLTIVGRANIDNLARYARTIEVVPNMTTRAKLNRLGLELVGDISWPEHCAIFTTPFKVAADIKVPLLVYGECPQEAYGGPPGADEAMQMTRRWVSEFGGFLGLRPADFVGQLGITAKDMEDYEPPANVDGIEAYFLGQFFEWNSHRNAEVAREHGMLQMTPTAANWWSHENLDNFQTGIHDMFMQLKYGFGRGCQQISVDVRAGKVSRDVALHWVEANDRWQGQYMGYTLPQILDHIGMDKEAFFECQARFGSAV
jgi:hypothetical protein